MTSPSSTCPMAALAPCLSPPAPPPSPPGPFALGGLGPPLFGGRDAPSLEAPAAGLAAADVVATSHGDHSAPVIVDASGWRAVLSPEARRDRRSVGIELRLPGAAGGLHFWVHHHSLLHGHTWDFPAAGPPRAPPRL